MIKLFKAVQFLIFSCTTAHNSNNNLSRRKSAGANKKWLIITHKVWWRAHNHKHISDIGYSQHDLAHMYTQGGIIHNLSYVHIWLTIIYSHIYEIGLEPAVYIYKSWCCMAHKHICTWAEWGGGGIKHQAFAQNHTHGGISHDDVYAMICYIMRRLRFRFHWKSGRWGGKSITYLVDEKGPKSLRDKGLIHVFSFHDFLPVHPQYQPLSITPTLPATKQGSFWAWFNHAAGDLVQNHTQWIGW